MKNAMKPAPATNTIERIGGDRICASALTAASSILV